MVRSVLSISTAVLTALGVAGCGAPFLHPAASNGTSDPGLVGEWETADPSQVRAVIDPPDAHAESGAGPYSAALTVHDHGEFKTALKVELILTAIGQARYVDLFLSRSERDKLVGTYGVLVVPVHQVLKVVRDGDTLTVWSLRADWLENHTASSVLSHERVTIGGGELPLVTAPTDRIRELLAQHGDDPTAFAEPMVFHRVTAAGRRP